MVAEQNEWLHGDTVRHIKDTQTRVKSMLLNLEHGLFPDVETRADFIVSTSARLREICEEMSNTVLIIAEHRLYEHEYAKEIQEAATLCYAAAMNAYNQFERTRLAA